MLSAAARSHRADQGDVARRGGVRLTLRAAAWLTILLAAGASGACGRFDRPPASRFGAIQRSVLNRSCAVPGCHLGPGTGSDLDLSPGASHGEIVNVRSTQIPDLLLVKPGHPDESYLIRKLEGTGIVGLRMPMGRAPLPAKDVAAIRRWIEAGAPDD